MHFKHQVLAAKMVETFVGFSTEMYGNVGGGSTVMLIIWRDEWMADGIFVGFKQNMQQYSSCIPAVFHQCSTSTRAVIHIQVLALWLKG